MAFSNDPALNEAEKLKSRCNEILVIAIYLVLVSTVLCETFFLIALFLFYAVSGAIWVHMRLYHLLCSNTDEKYTEETPEKELMQQTQNSHIESSNASSRLE